jgi:hypothetical protein
MISRKEVTKNVRRMGKSTDGGEGRSGGSSWKKMELQRKRSCECREKAKRGEREQNKERKRRESRRSWKIRVDVNAVGRMDDKKEKFEV